MLFLESWLLALFIAPPAGILGCFLVWRRMAFFAETLAHASVLGMSLALFIKTHLILGISFSGAIVCLFMWSMRNRKDLPADALLSLTSHVMLGAGIIVIALADIRVDLLAYLLGEWLVVTWGDVLLESGVMLVIILTLWMIRKPLLSTTAQAEIAKVELRDNWRGNFLFFVLLTLFISVSVQTVGLLLLNTLMIIPALTARHWSKTPYGMMVLSVLLAAVIICSGLALSFSFDLPASPSAAVCGGLIFGLSVLFKYLLNPRP